MPGEYGRVCRESSLIRWVPLQSLKVGARAENKILNPSQALTWRPRHRTESELTVELVQVAKGQRVIDSVARHCDW